MSTENIYRSKYFTAQEIDQRLLQGYYDDAVKKGFVGSLAEFQHRLSKINLLDKLELGMVYRGYVNDGTTLPLDDNSFYLTNDSGNYIDGEGNVVTVATDGVSLIQRKGGEWKVYTLWELVSELNNASSTRFASAKAVKTLKDMIDQLAQGGSGGGGSVMVDSELSETSLNPVQNTVITAALNKLGKAIEDATAENSVTTDKIVNYAVSEEKLSLPLSDKIGSTKVIAEKAAADIGLDNITLLQGGIDAGGSENVSSYYLRTSRFSIFKLELNDGYTIGQLAQYDLAGNFVALYSDYTQTLENVEWAPTSVVATDKEYMWVAIVFKGNSPTVAISPREAVVKTFVSGLYYFMKGEESDPQSAAQQAKAVVNRAIEQLPNEEDLTLVDGKMQMANRAAAVKDGKVANLGYVILRKDKSFTEQVAEANTIYEIRYNFDLGGETVTLKEGCTLKFVGGKIDNGVVNFNNCRVSTSGDNIFGKNLTNYTSGGYVSKIDNEIYLEYFDADNDDDRLDRALTFCPYIVLRKTATYKFSKTHVIGSNTTIIAGEEHIPPISFRQKATYANFNNATLEYNGQDTFLILRGSYISFIGGVIKHTNIYGEGDDVAENYDDKMLVLLDADGVNSTDNYVNTTISNTEAKAPSQLATDKNNPTVEECELAAKTLRGIAFCIKAVNGGFVLNNYIKLHTTGHKCSLKVDVDKSTSSWATSNGYDIETRLNLCSIWMRGCSVEQINANCQGYHCNTSNFSIFSKLNIPQVYFDDDSGIEFDGYIWDVDGGDKYQSRAIYLSETTERISFADNIRKKNTQRLRSIYFKEYIVDKGTFNDVYEFRNIGDTIQGDTTHNYAVTFDKDYNVLNSLDDLGGVIVSEENCTLNNGTLIYRDRDYNFKCTIKPSGDLDAAKIEFSYRFLRNNQYTNAIEESFESIRSFYLSVDDTEFVSIPNYVIFEGYYNDTMKYRALIRSNQLSEDRFPLGYSKVDFNFINYSTFDHTYKVDYFLPPTGGQLLINGAKVIIIGMTPAKIASYTDQIRLRNIYIGSITPVRKREIGFLHRGSNSKYRPTFAMLGQRYFDTTIKKPIWYNGSTWVNADGNPADVLYSGTTEQRPTGVSLGFQFFDKTLSKPIWWNGSKWVDSTGVEV